MGLDADGITKLHRLIDQFRQQGKGIIVITHDEKMAAHADRIVVIRDGLIAPVKAQRESSLFADR